MHEVLDLKDCLNIEEQDLLKLLTERPGLHITYGERDSSEEDVASPAFKYPNQCTRLNFELCISLTVLQRTKITIMTGHTTSQMPTISMTRRPQPTLT